MDVPRECHEAPAVSVSLVQYEIHFPESCSVFFSLSFSCEEAMIACLSYDSKFNQTKPSIFFTMSSAESVCETGAPTLEQLPGSVDKQNLAVLGIDALRMYANSLDLSRAGSRAELVGLIRTAEKRQEDTNGKAPVTLGTIGL